MLFQFSFKTRKENEKRWRKNEKLYDVDWKAEKEFQTRIKLKKKTMKNRHLVKWWIESFSSSMCRVRSRCGHSLLSTFSLSFVSLIENCSFATYSNSCSAIQIHKLLKKDNRYFFTFFCLLFVMWVSNSPSLFPHYMP